MSSRNHALTYRPVLGGTLIINPANGRPGTLGFVGTRDGTDRYAVSCYHVLGRADGGPVVDGEVVIQSLEAKGGSAIGRIHRGDCAVPLDVAAARLDPGIAAWGRLLAMGPLGLPTAPQQGMRVLKAGAVTGVTEGTVNLVQGTRVEIRKPAGYPIGYELCDFGDSGALWVDASTGCPVALHTSQSPNGDAIAVELGAVLSALNLRLAPKS